MRNTSLDTIRWALQNGGRCDLKNLLLVVALLLAWPTVGLTQAGQVIPTYTVFGGFTTVRSRFDYGSSGVPGFPTVPGPVFYLNGWEASIERKFAPWIGIVADVSQQLGTRSGGHLGPEQENQVSVLFGPQFSLRVAHWLIPFAHVLIGPSYGLADYLSLGTAGTVSSFATAIGGGVDVKILGPVWLRAAQVDYLHSSNDFGEDHSMQVRISVGIAFRF
jgi:hypothetical protein